MKSNLLQFLFNESQQREEVEDILDDGFAKLLEQAAEEEDKEMTANKKSLSAALNDVDLKCCKSDGPEDNVLCLDSREDYADAVRKLSDPEVMHKLATSGWVALLGGDTNMHNEEPNFVIKFLEIKTADTGDGESGEKMKGVLDKAREFATTELDRDDDSNPVDSTDDDIKKVKLPKAKDGETPASVKEGVTAAEMVNTLLEGGVSFKQKAAQKVKLAKKTGKKKK